MIEVKWDNSLSIGIELIDAQHREMISKISQLAAAISENRGSASVIKTFDFLSEYTNFHFSTEEKHMIEQNYPGIQYHLKQHDKFKKTLKNLLIDFKEEGATVNLVESINQLLINWFIKHITNVDIEFGKFLRAKGLNDIKE